MKRLGGIDLKIKLSVSEKRDADIKAFFTEKGIEIDNDADLILSERGQYAEFVIGKKDHEIHRIKTDDIVFIESLGKQIILHTLDAEYNISERLKQLESMLDPERFLRISNSVIIDRAYVKKIKPTLTTKFILTLSNGSTVDVTRSYYYMFRERFGI